MHDRKVIRGHATRSGAADRHNIPLRSWISPNRELRALAAASNSLNSKSNSSASIPTRVGGEFSGLQLPSGVEPAMIQDLLKLIDVQKYGVYPYEVCFNVHVVERGWFPYMINDICCLHSMMFLVRAFLESASHDRLSKSACFHYGQTLHILQARLDKLDHTSALSDATIMVVITLEQAAELTGDLAAVANHARGLEKIVDLRGGVRALNTHNNIQVKVCRADLAYALLSGHRPYFLKEGLSWDCFIANRDLIHCSHLPHEAHVCAFAERAMDSRLHNVLKDLHAFSCLSNLAYQTTRKLSPEMYNEMMISVLYRLTHLSFEDDVLQETIRSGLLVFASAIFMQRQLMGQPYDHLQNLYHTALCRLRKAPDIGLPISLILWLTVLSYMAAPQELDGEEWRKVWLNETMSKAGIDSWSQLREMLKSIAWVDFIHDRIGKDIFESVILRVVKQIYSDA